MPGQAGLNGMAQTFSLQRQHSCWRLRFGRQKAPEKSPGRAD